MNSTIKQALNLFGLLGITLGLSGCVVAIGSTREKSPPPASPPPVVVTDSAEAATIAEIDAAARLNMDGDRAQLLSQIAGRTTLSAAVQVYLVNTAYARLSFDGSKTQVLSKIITRPDFGDATRHAIVSQLNRLSFDGSRQQVLQQINERLKNPPAH